MKSVSRLFCAISIGVAIISSPARAHDPHDPFISVAVSPNFAQDHTVLAATALLSIKMGTQVVMKSTDAGVTWSVVPNLSNNSVLAGVAFSPAYGQDQTMYVAAGAGLFRSTNQGSSWTAMTNQSMKSLALSPQFATDNMLFVVTTANTVLKSTDRGQTLTPIPVPAPLQSGVTQVAVSPNYASDNTLLLGTGADGIFKSVNGGAAWAPVTTGLTLPSVTALTFSPAFATDQTAFAGTMGAGFLISGDGGSTWTAANTGLSDLNVTSLALSPSYTQSPTIWAATAVNGVFQSNAPGGAWAATSPISRALSSLSAVHYQSIAAAPGTSNVLLFLGSFEGFWSSSDIGASWQYSETLPTRLIRHINISPGYSQDRTIFTSTYGGGNLWSYDGGASWNFQNTGLQAPYTDGSAISPSYAVDGTAFSGNHVGLQKTTDRGATWQLLQNSYGSAYPRAVAVSPNYSQDATLFVGVTVAPGTTAACVPAVMHGNAAAAGLYISKNGGNSWTFSSVGGAGVIAIAVSPAFASDHIMLAGTDSLGLYRSLNGGTTWSPLSIPGSPKSLADVKFSPNFATDRIIMAASSGGGIFRSTDAGATWTQLPQTALVKATELAFSPNFAADQTVFAGTVQLGLMKSTNGGRSLSAVTGYPDTFILSVAVSPNYAQDATVFAASYHGLYRSADGGNTWSYVVTPARIEESRNVSSFLQEPPTISYQGSGWTFPTGSLQASSYGYATTAQSQNTATVSFVGSGIRWLSWTGAGQGSASIQLDGASEGTISLTGQSDLFQQSVWEQHGLTCGPHTFTVTGLPQGSQTVTVDAFDIWTDNCTNTFYSNPASLGNSSTTVGGSAGAGAVLLITTGPWTATSNAPWLHISPLTQTGAGSALVLFTYDANPNSTVQNGTLTIAGLTFVVTQAGANYSMGSTLNPLVEMGLSNPKGVAVDQAGNVYIADTGSSAIRVWNAVTQQVSTLVAPGLNNPAGVAVDKQGNVYIADTGSSALREWVAGTQQVVTPVSSGLLNPAGVAVDAKGNVYIADTGNNAIKLWNPATQQLTALVSSGLSGPSGVAVDAQGNVYISDTGNNAVKEWTVGQQLITLVSGSIAAPYGIAVDGQGNVYFSDSGNQAIKQWNPATQQVTTLASGAGTPAGLCIDAQNNLYLADQTNSVIRRLVMAFVALSANVRSESALAGTDSIGVQVLPVTVPITAMSDQPWLTITGVAGGVVSFAFTANTGSSPRVAHIGILGQQVTLTQSGVGGVNLMKTGGDNQTAGLNQPFTVPLQVTVTDSNGIPQQGVPVTFAVVPGPTGAAGTFSATPHMPVATDQNGNAVSPVLTGNGTAGQFAATASINGASVSFSLAISTGPALMTKSGGDGQSTLAGTVFGIPLQVKVTDAGGSSIAGLPVAFSVVPGPVGASGTFGTGSTASATTDQNGIAAAPVLTANSTGGAFTVTASAGGVSVTFNMTNLSAGSSMLLGSMPAGGAVYLTCTGPWTASSNASWLHLSSGNLTGTGNALLQFTYDANPNPAVQTAAITACGTLFTITQAGAGFTPASTVISMIASGLNKPQGVAVDSQGNLYIADTTNNAVKVWTAATQTIATLPISVNTPLALAVDSRGNVYIADSKNNAVKEWVAATQQVTTLVSSGIASPTGVAVDSNGNVYISDAGHNAVKMWSASTQQVSTLISTGLNVPRGLAIDILGNLYIADCKNNAIKQWSPSTGTVTQLPIAGLNTPYSVAVDPYGNLYIADSLNNAIRQWGLASQQLATVVSTGLKSPTGVASDSQGNLWIADMSNNAIKQLRFAQLSFGAGSLTEGAGAGSDSVTVQVLPSNTPLGPTSDQAWLTVTGMTANSINFTFGANLSCSTRTAHITVLGQQVTVTQNGSVPTSIVKAAGNAQATSPGQLFATALTVRLKDAAGNAVQNAPVTFTVNAGSAGSAGTFNSSTTVTVNTTAGGYATTPALLANSIPGTFTVTATAGSLSTTFSLTITSP
ncbi:MAG: BACON domain-containing carbohydrate-binding protein [Bryobacteraceae bacterium]